MQQRPVASLLIDSIEDYFTNDETTFLTTDLEACTNRLVQAVDEEDVSFSEYMYAKLLTTLYNNTGRDCYDAFKHLHAAFGLYLSPPRSVHGRKPITYTLTCCAQKIPRVRLRHRQEILQRRRDGLVRYC